MSSIDYHINNGTEILLMGVGIVMFIIFLPVLLPTLGLCWLVGWVGGKLGYNP